MFEAVVVVRNSAPGLGPLDLGHLAEAMLFYRTVRLCLTRGSLRQLINTCGPELVLELVENSNLDVVYLDADVGVYSVNTGTRHERHMPVSFKILERPTSERVYEDAVTSLFREVTGKSGKGRRFANRFMKHSRPHDLPESFTVAAQADWQNASFSQKAVRVFLTEYAPSYPGIDDVRVILHLEEDGYFTVDTNLDRQELQKAYVQRGDMKQLSIVDMLSGMTDAREDLYLAATFGAAVAQSSYFAQLTRAICADLTAIVDRQHAIIDQFQDLVVHGLNDLAGAINTKRCSFEDFLKILKKADDFRAWLDVRSPDEDLVRSYFKEASKDSWLAKEPAKKLRWMIPAAAGFASFIPGIAPFLPDAALTVPTAALGLTAIDQLVIERVARGWRPSSFIDNELRPLVNR